MAPVESRLQTYAQRFLEENYKDVVGQARKRFHLDLPASSVGSVVTGDTHILYYIPFMCCPIELEQGVKIMPGSWALAFLQMDLKSITRELCQALFTIKDLEQRRVKGPEAGLNQVTKLVISRAAVWLMNKNQDPWSYVPQNGMPSEEQAMQIDEVFATFDRVNGLCINELDSCTLTAGGNVGFVGLPKDTTTPEQENSFYNAIFRELLEQVSSSKNPKERINAAQLAGALTKATIPNNTDVIVDGVQSSQPRWAAATRKFGACSIAEKLFNKHFKLDFTNIGVRFTNIEDLNPVKRVAIYRAVAWIMRMQTKAISACPYDFDSQISEHNVFPSSEELKCIDDHLTMVGLQRQQDADEGCQLIQKDSSGAPFAYQSSSGGSDASLASAYLQSGEDMSFKDDYQITNGYDAPGVQLNHDANVYYNLQNVDPNAGRLNEPPQTITFKEIDGGYRLPMDQYTEALGIFQGEGNIDKKSEKAGKYLVSQQFPDAQESNITLGGRSNTTKADERKVNNILAFLKYMEDNDDADFDQWNKAKENVLLKNVFTETFNYSKQRQKIQAKRNSTQQ